MESNKVHPAVILLENVNFNYGTRTVLQDVNLTVNRGDFLGIVGPNGGGKTTLLKVMLGLLKPDSGEVHIFGNNADVFSEHHKIGYIPQKASQFDPDFPATVYEVTCMGRFPRLGFFRRMKRPDHEQVEKALRVVDMLELKDQRIGRLSGGQQQRVFIARALAGEPEIMILDEPTTGVDIKAQDKFYSLLKTLNHDMNLTLLLVSHDIGMVSDYVTKLACINRSIHYHGRADKFDDSDMSKAYGPDMSIVTHKH